MEKKLKPIVETYNTDEEYLYSKSYLFIKGFATGRDYQNTLKALPLARLIHNGQYRKGETIIDGQTVHLPYIVHCLKVCSTLMSLNFPLTDKELDLLYAGAILHDTLEDGERYFPKGGEEYFTEYGLDKEIANIIKLLSKHTGADEYELNEYFNEIKKNKIALLIKLADRSHNVEDLYNMKNIPKYIKETRDYFLNKNSLCSYAKAHYPEISNGVTILKSKILSLTEATEVMLNKYTEIIKEKDNEINSLKQNIDT